MAEVSFVLRVCVGGTLLLAATSKSRDLSGFRVGMGRFMFVPRRMSRALAILVPVAESALGVLLIVGVTVLVISAICAVMLLSFTMVQTVNYARGNRVACQCFGSDPLERISLATIARGAVLVTMAGLLTLLPVEVRLDAASATALVSISFGCAAALRLLGLTPVAVNAFRLKPLVAPAWTNRVSFRHSPLDVSLVVRAPEPITRNGHHPKEVLR